MGLYDNIVQQGTVAPQQGTSGGLDVNAKTIEGLIKLRNAVWSVLPDGQLKRALLSASPDLFSIFKTMISLLQGRRYYEQEYKLGERLLDQIQCQNVGWRDVPDEIVPIARLVFTQLFGVRITSNEDLDALDIDEDAYFRRGGKNDISWEQATRAVTLKKNFYPPSTYNTTCWDLSAFDRYPLIGKIPEMNADDHGGEANIGKFYTGPGFNGQKIVDGLLVGVVPVPVISTGGTPGTVAYTPLDRLRSFVQNNKLLAAAAVAAIVYVIDENENR